MMSFLRRHKTTFFIATIATFLIGTFVGLGGYLFTSRDMSGTVASVGAAKIPYQDYVTRVNQYTEAVRSRGGDVSDDMVKEIKQAMLREMIVDELLQQKADEMGLVVTDGELSRDIQSTPAFQRDGKFDQQLYFARVRQVFRDSPEAYERNRRKAIKAMKVKQMIYHSAKLSPSEVAEAYKASKKGSMKDFEKEKASFEVRAQQARALDLINYYLKQLAQQVEIRTYLEQRESGV
jgi:peptidyl-prolyl cis-trans isomerase D